MNYREQVITEWTNCKQKTNQAISELKEQVNQASNPELRQLENQIKQKNDLLITKQEQLTKLRKKIVPVLNETDSTNNQSHRNQIEQVEREIRELENDQQQLINKLETLWPQQAKIAKLETKLKQLNYLYSLENSLQERALENTQYLLRIQRAEEKWANSEKKLELIRDLLVSGSTSKLLDLYKHGKI